MSWNLSKLYSELFIIIGFVENVLESLYLLCKVIVYVDNTVITGSDNGIPQHVTRNSKLFKASIRNENGQTLTPETNCIL